MTALFVAGPQPPQRAGRGARAAGRSRRTSCARSSPICRRRRCCARWWCSPPATASRSTAWPRRPGEARALAFRHLCRQRGIDLGRGRSRCSTRISDDEAVAPRLPGRGQPRLDDARRAADPRPGEGRLRAGAVVRARWARVLHALLEPGLRRGQAGAHRDRDRRATRSRSPSPRWSWREKIFGEPRRAGGAAGRRGQDERAGRPAPGRAGRVPDLRGQPHLGAGPGAGARAGRARRCRSRSSRPRWPRGHRGHLDRRRPSRSSPRRHGRAGRCTGAAARPLFFIDIAVPRDVEPGVDELDDVFCYDIDDLQAVVDANLARARARGPAGRGAGRARGRQVPARGSASRGRPTIVSLRERLEEIRLAEVKRDARRGCPTPRRSTRAAIEALSTAIVNKILHAPITKLARVLARGRRPLAGWSCVHELFGLGRRT